MGSSDIMTTMAMETKRLPLGEFSSSRINKLGASSQKKVIKTKLPSIKTLIDYTPPVPVQFTSGPAESLPAVSPVALKDAKAPQDLATASEKLRVRLQFAYFKLRTNRAHATFRELKSQLEEPATRPNSRKRRKLVVSQGNYRTSLDPPKGQDEPQNFLHFSGPNAASIHATPRSKHQRSLSSLQRQNTPMRVKAAKSLLHLFTSNQQ